MSPLPTPKSVLVTRLLPPKAQQRLEHLKKNGRIILDQWPSMTHAMPRQDLLTQLQHHDGLLCLLTDKIDKHLLDKSNSPKLQCVSSMSVGLDHVDVRSAAARGIRVANTPGVLTDCTADLTLGLLLATLRKFSTAIQAVKTAGEWGAWHPLQFVGTSLSRKCVGIVGMGAIGQAVASRLIPFKISGLYYTTGSGFAKALSGDVGDKAVHMKSLHEMLSVCDVVIVACSLTDATRGLFGLEEFKRMKSGSTFINVSRGGVVKQDELVTALKENKDRPLLVGLDVTDPEPLDPANELLSYGERVLVLPHIGSATVETREAMADLAIDNLLRGLEIDDPKSKE